MRQSEPGEIGDDDQRDTAAYRVGQPIRSLAAEIDAQRRTGHPAHPHEQGPFRLEAAQLAARDVLHDIEVGADHHRRRAEHLQHHGRDEGHEVVEREQGGRDDQAGSTQPQHPAPPQPYHQPRHGEAGQQPGDGGQEVQHADLLRAAQQVVGLQRDDRRHGGPRQRVERQDRDERRPARPGQCGDVDAAEKGGKTAGAVHREHSITGRL